MSKKRCLLLWEYIRERYADLHRTAPEDSFLLQFIASSAQTKPLNLNSYHVQSLRILAAQLGISPDWVLGGKGAAVCEERMDEWRQAVERDTAEKYETRWLKIAAYVPGLYVAHVGLRTAGQASFSDFLGLPAKDFSKLAHGDIHADVLATLTYALRISVDWMLFGNGKSPEGWSVELIQEQKLAPGQSPEAFMADALYRSIQALGRP